MIVNTEGFRSLFRGCIPNIFKSTIGQYMMIAYDIIYVRYRIKTDVD